MSKNLRAPPPQPSISISTSHSLISHSNTDSNTKCTDQPTDTPPSTHNLPPNLSSASPHGTPTQDTSHPIDIPKGSNPTFLGLSPPASQSPEGGFARDVFVSRRGQKLRMGQHEELSNAEDRAESMKAMKGTRRVARSFEKDEGEKCGPGSEKKDGGRRAEGIGRRGMDGEVTEEVETEGGMSSGEEVEGGSESEWEVVSSDGEGRSYKMRFRGRDSMV